MNEEALKENIRTLAQILGTGEKKAVQILKGRIRIFFDERDHLSRELTEFLVMMLRLTVDDIEVNPDILEVKDLAIVVGSVVIAPRSDLRIRIDSKQLLITHDSSKAIEHSSSISDPIWALVSACYSAAQVVRLLVGDSLPVPQPTSIRVEREDIFGVSFSANETFDIETSWLVGAGAIGNAFVYALSLINPIGELHIADPDIVEGGNLNRCICFGDCDLGLNKAKQLGKWAQLKIKDLKVIPHSAELAKVPQREEGAWLPRLVVAVDSRLARRHIQNEIPGEIFDASTTDIRECVFHFNRQPLEGDACMSCIYFQDSSENAHEQHVAEALGVTLADVRAQFVTAESAEKIAAKNSHVKAAEIVNLAYDSLFKQLCGEAKLLSPEDKQVFPPFAFVSVLAGTILAIEFKRRITDPQFPRFNYWKVSPWAGPVVRAQRNRKKLEGCTFCTNALMQKLALSFWNH